MEVDQGLAVEVAGLAHHQRVARNFDLTFAHRFRHALEATPGQPGDRSSPG